MSITSDITRLTGAKTDIGTAIAAKGVTVASGTKLDGMAALIGQISGGLPSNITKLEGGSFTVSTTQYYYDVTHTLGVTPLGFIFWTTDAGVIGSTPPASFSALYCGLAMKTAYQDAADGASLATFPHFYRHTNGNMVPREAIFTQAEADAAFNSTTIRIGISLAKTSARFYPGATYQYLIFA